MIQERGKEEYLGGHVLYIRNGREKKRESQFFMADSV